MILKQYPQSTPKNSRKHTGKFKAAGIVSLSCSFLLITASFAGVPAAFAAEAKVNLGTSDSFSVLGGQEVTNTGATILDQDLGVSPGTSITGFPPGIVLGTIHQTDAVAAQAQSDLVIAYDDAASRAPTQSISGELVGQTFVGGVYEATEPLSLSGTVTLDAQGDPNTVFIFKTPSTLITASDSTVALINGAQACNVYWQVGSSATLGTSSDFKGSILALTSITVDNSTVVEGRALARNGTVTLNENVFSTPGCATAIDPIEETPTTPPVEETPTETPTETPSETPTDTPTTPPTDTPTDTPTTPPTDVPTDTPTTPPTDVPTDTPSTPTDTPTDTPSTPTDTFTDTSTDTFNDDSTDTSTDTGTGESNDDSSTREELAKTGASTNMLSLMGALMLGLGGAISLFATRQPKIARRH